MRLAWTALLLSLLPASLAATGMARTEYRSLYGVFKASAAVTPFERLIAIPKIESKNPSVRADTIDIVIQAQSGAIHIPIDSMGRAEFPLREELLRENPGVVSNQPAGSLRVSLVVEVKPPQAARSNYGEWLDAMHDVEAATTALGQDYRDAPIEGLEFRFDPAAHAQVSITWSGGEDLLVADVQGRVFLRRDDGQTRGRDAAVTMSAAALRVLPRVGKKRP